MELIVQPLAPTPVAEITAAVLLAKGPAGPIAVPSWIRLGPPEVCVRR
jgi:hypothetical protein